MIGGRLDTESTVVTVTTVTAPVRADPHGTRPRLPAQLAEADLNPLLSGPHGVRALGVRVRLVPRSRHDPYLRRLC